MDIPNWVFQSMTPVTCIAGLSTNAGLGFAAISISENGEEHD